MAVTQMIRRDAIVPSKTNPRKTFTGLEELAQSFRDHGMIQAVVVRLVQAKGKPMHELVVGERRWRAAAIAELAEIPCEVRDLSDQQVREIQHVENAQREDVPPLEEADSYGELVAGGMTVEQIAGTVGKSKSHIAQRLKLTDLVPEGRVALETGKLVLGVAMLIARLSAKQQKEVLPRMLSEGRRGHFVEPDDAEPFTISEASEMIRRLYMLKLKQAPFDLRLANLVPAAGSCVACPKRTGNQQDLFADVEETDTCTDPVCYAKKCDAEWKRRSSAEGANVLTAEETKKTFPHGYMAHDAPFVALDEHAVYVKRKEVTWRDLIGEAGPPTVLARKPSRQKDDPGEIVELVRREDLREVLPKLKAKWAKDAVSQVTATRSEKRQRSGPSPDAKFREEKLIKSRASSITHAAIVALASKKPMTDASLRLVVDHVLDSAWAEQAKDVLARREIEVVVRKDDYSGRARKKALEDLAERLKGPELFAFLLEMILSRGNDAFEKKVAAHYKVDAAKNLATARAELKAKKAARKPKGKKAAKKKAKPSKKAKPPTPGVCRVCGCTEKRACTSEGYPCCWANLEMTLCSACAP